MSFLNPSPVFHEKYMLGCMSGKLYLGVLSYVDNSLSMAMPVCSYMNKCAATVLPLRIVRVFMDSLVFYELE